MFRYSVPAMALVVLAATGDAVSQEVPASRAAVEAGTLAITAPFVRATLPNQPVAGGFMTIANTGETTDTLVGIRSDVAGRMEIHEMAMEGDVMRMRAVPDGLPIPAGETVTLAPGGYHVMFMELETALDEGDAVDITLSFEGAGDVSLTMPVLNRTAQSAAEGE